jgi:hypothetical protein
MQAEMGRQVAVALYVVAMVAVIQQQPFNAAFGVDLGQSH